MRAAGITAVVAGAFISIAYVGNIVALMHTTVANAMLLITGRAVAGIRWSGEG